jgi:hypothetical protein
MRPFVGLIRRGISGREAGSLGIEDENAHGVGLSVCCCQYKETQGLLYIGILISIFSRVADLASPFVSFTTFIPLALLRSGFSRRRSLRVTRSARSAPLALLRSGLRLIGVIFLVREGGAPVYPHNEFPNATTAKIPSTRPA